ncbi:hypothetical protein ACPPVO_27995 [Dactylosporangium sp. McL0621]|uniref:hypothetical protein n=1 Tax=Dactylosporangium sp. McL0621 TaxID=3415678 RepID=UPI003CF51670
MVSRTLGEPGWAHSTVLRDEVAALGRGRRLFDGPAAPGGLRLVEARAFAAGIVLVRYRTV